MEGANMLAMALVAVGCFAWGYMGGWTDANRTWHRCARKGLGSK
jgi:hypothetical protein